MASNVRMSRPRKATRRGGGGRNGRPPSVLLSPLTRDTVVVQMSRNRMHRINGRIYHVNNDTFYIHFYTLSLSQYVYTCLFSGLCL